MRIASAPGARLPAAPSLTALLLLTSLVPAVAQDSATPRPMTFLDMQHMKSASSARPSPDGRWMLYTVSTPDCKEAKRQTDVFLVSLEQGLPSTRQMTFTKEKNETSPAWSRDGTFFVFASNRDAPNDGNQNQLYLMRPDGGESRRITDAKDGVSSFAFSKDGRWLAYRAGKSGEEQLWRLPVAGIDSAKASHETPGGRGARTGRRMYASTSSLRTRSTRTTRSDARSASR
jgi:Tol biopolymer transport system component